MRKVRKAVKWKIEKSVKGGKVENQKSGKVSPRAQKSKKVSALVHNVRMLCISEPGFCGPDTQR